MVKSKIQQTPKNEKKEKHTPKKRKTTKIKGSLQVETRGRKHLQDCHICYNKIEIQGRINCCDHLFCFNCIKKWSEVSNY